MLRPSHVSFKDITVTITPRWLILRFWSGLRNMRYFYLRVWVCMTCPSRACWCEKSCLQWSNIDLMHFDSDLLIGARAGEPVSCAETHQLLKGNQISVNRPLLNSAQTHTHTPLYIIFQPSGLVHLSIFHREKYQRNELHHW